jgi:translation elongation factor EF-Tu-like GTPase
METCSKIAFEQSNIAPLQTTARTIHMKQQLTGTGKHVLLQPQNGILIKAIQKQELHRSNILQKGTSLNQHKKKAWPFTDHASHYLLAELNMLTQTALFP